MKQTKTFDLFIVQNCEKAVKRFRSEAQILVERKHPEHEQIELQLQEIDKKLSMIHFSIDDYRQNAEQIVTFYRLIDEVDFHCLFVRVGKEYCSCRNSGRSVASRFNGNHQSNSSSNRALSNRKSN